MPENKETTEKMIGAGRGYLSFRATKIFLAHTILFSMALLLSFLFRYDMRFSPHPHPQEIQIEALQKWLKDKSPENREAIGQTKFDAYDAIEVLLNSNDDEKVKQARSAIIEEFDINNNFRKGYFREMKVVDLRGDYLVRFVKKNIAEVSTVSVNISDRYWFYNAKEFGQGKNWDNTYPSLYVSDVDRTDESGKLVVHICNMIRNVRGELVAMLVVDCDVAKVLAYRRPPSWLWTFVWWLLVTLLVKHVIFGFLHQYRGWWRYVSVPDLFAIIRGAFISTVILIFVHWLGMSIARGRGLLVILSAIDKVPESVILLDWIATIVVVCGARLAIRLYYEETRQTQSAAGVTRILIVGAGNAGELLLREINRMSEIVYKVEGFIDDDPRKLGVRIHGVPVLGNAEQIREIAMKRKVEEIVIALPSATNKQIRRVISFCQGAHLRFSTVPDLIEIASGKLSVSQMRDVDINDLLGRAPVELDTRQISEFIKNKVVMITGAGGSIGSEMCRQVGHYQPKMLVLIEQAENFLFFIERELNRNFPDIDIVAVICDVADRVRLDHVFDRYRPEVVIHAAAHKHVPLMELNPGEAIKNNVVGTRNVAEMADKYGTGNFVFISTDKAVNPTSIMGSSKRLAEMFIQCLNKRSKTDFSMVRFGNVLGSNGSVIPIFRQQIAAGGPVTVTHPDMQRYFMTIPEASQLVLQAATMGRGGEVFVLDMGEPVKIADLARDLITLSGFTVGEDIEINYTGMRPGEKLFEELATTGENMQPTRHPKIAIWNNVPPSEEQLDSVVQELIGLSDSDDHQAIVIAIKKVVPEYVGDVDSKQLHEKHLAKNGNSDNKTGVI
ncbi:MAG: polysaccharide biosynthesis protein [Sedimentisphaerales bacterium]|nr:polysaccharide biosynthesis protein [Sedimentisphaerales bacterium]